MPRDSYEAISHYARALSGRWTPRASAVFVGALCGLLGQLTSHVLFVKPAEITSIWIPGGLILAFLVTRPLRVWFFLCFGFVVGGVLAFTIRSGMVLIPAIGYIWMTICIICGAAYIKLGPSQKSLFPTVGHLIRFFVVVVVGCSVACSAGFVGVVSLIRDDIHLPRLWMLSTTANAVGFMLITPLVVDLQRVKLPAWVEVRSRVIGFIIFSAVLWVISILAWYAAPSNLSSVPLALFAPIPLLMLAAFQFGRLGPSVGLIVAFFPAIVVAIRLDKVSTFEIGLVNSYIMQLWTLAAGVLVHALAIQASQRDDILRRLYATSEENKSLASRLIQSQEEQSSKISRELHDGVNQKLTFFAIALTAVRRSATEAVRQPISEVVEGIKVLIDEVRDISHSLHPSILEHAGLAGAIDDLVRVIKGRWGGEIFLSVESDGHSSDLKGDRALCVYRVAQEAIRNAVEHSDATVIKVVLLGEEGVWRLRVWDNGKGFVVDEALTRSGLGLVSMKERVRSEGGKLRIRSRLGIGTRVMMEIAE